jgi:hypothetical protein
MQVKAIPYPILATCDAGKRPPSDGVFIPIKVQIDPLFYHKERKEHKDQLLILEPFSKVPAFSCVIVGVVT